MSSKMIVRQNELVEFDTVSLLTAWKANLDLVVDAGVRSPDTARTYKKGCEKFFTWLDGEFPNGESILKWMSFLRKAGMKSSSINSWLSGVRAFFVYATAKSQIPFDPSQGIPRAKRSGANKHHVRGILTDAEVKRLLSQPDQSTIEGKRDYAMLMIQLYTAGRGIELNRADLVDVSTENNRMILKVQGKGEDTKEEKLILVAEVAEALSNWIAIHPKGSKALFVSLSDRSYGERLSRSATRQNLKAYFHTAGIVGNKTIHSLRHTAITNALSHGVPLQRVSKMFARHMSIDTTMIYVHEIDKMSDPVEEHIFYESN